MARQRALKAGSYATETGEPRQDRKVAAVNFGAPGAVGLPGWSSAAKPRASRHPRTRAHGHEEEEWSNGVMEKWSEGKRILYNTPLLPYSITPVFLVERLKIKQNV